MNIKPICNDDDLWAAFQRLETIFQAEEGTPEADEREIWVALIEVYENKHYPIGPAIVRVRCKGERPPGSCPSKR